LTTLTKTVAIYVFFDAILKAMNHKEPPGRKTTDSAIITVTLIAARYFGGDIESSRCFVRFPGLRPDMIIKSRFNRRLREIAELLSELFFHLGHVIKGLNINSTYSANCFPAGVCHNIRISCSRIVKGGEYRGYCASKRVYFYGYGVHMMVTSDDIPAEFSFTAGRTADIDGFRQLLLDFLEGSEYWLMPDMPII
jgi:hypothetical protein